MCFRPAVVKNVCPQCATDNFPGVLECRECGAKLDGGKEPPREAAPGAPAPSAPGAPAAPQAPKS